MLYYAVLRPMVVETMRKVERMKKFGIIVKVMEVSSGNFYTKRFRSRGKAENFCAFVNHEGTWASNKWSAGAHVTASIVE